MSGSTVANMMENGPKTKCVDSAFLNGLMADSIKDTSQMIKDTARAKCTTPTEPGTSAAGSKVSKTAKDNFTKALN